MHHFDTKTCVVYVPFLCMRTGTIQFHTGGSMAQYHSGVSNMQSTRAPVGIFDLGVSKFYDVY
jgi:hypothetical protein